MFLNPAQSAWHRSSMCRPFHFCPELVKNLDVLPIVRWLSYAIHNTKFSSQLSLNACGRQQLLWVAVMWPDTVLSLQVLLQKKGPAEIKLAEEMGLAHAQSFALRTRVEETSLLSPTQLLQTTRERRIAGHVEDIGLWERAIQREQVKINLTTKDVKRGQGFSKPKNPVKSKAVSKHPPKPSPAKEIALFQTYLDTAREALRDARAEQAP